MNDLASSPLVIGVDFGTDSARALVVDARTGAELSSAVAFYPRWVRGLYQHPEAGVFRQHPADYLEALEQCVAEAVSALTPEQAESVVGVGVDTTGSTPAPVDENGTPLALLNEFAENENAMFQLWKDHSASEEGSEINELFRHGSGTDYTLHQGKYSAEWFWCKVLHTVRTDPAIRQAAFTFVEHCEWIVGTLCGNTGPETMYHSACTAGHKLFWHRDWNGLPGGDVLGKADPYLCSVRARFGQAPRPASVRAGSLTPEWARRFGLRPGIAVAGSSCDAHAGAVGAGIRPGTAVCTLGTSACTLLVERPEALLGKAREIGFYAGTAEDSILPGYTGIESGQAAFGDIFAWFRRLMLWPLSLSADPDGRTEAIREQILPRIEAEAAALPDEPFPAALDWFNGRRYPDTDNTQTAAIDGLSLHTGAPELYRALAFGAAAGLKRNLDGLEQAGLTINDVAAVGGIAAKSPYVIQMLADLMEKEVSVLNSAQVCAIGAAVYAATAAGVYPDMETALPVMAAKKARTFVPNAAKRDLYRAQYERYLSLSAGKERS